MNQIFRITVGQDTLGGRLAPVRVGKGYWCRFLIYGTSHAEGIPSPKIWIETDTGTFFWTGLWDASAGAWVIDVSPAAADTVVAKTYALTVFSEIEDQEFFVGQAAFVVYDTIASGGETGGTAGVSISLRLTEIETWMSSLKELADFDPETAEDFQLREHLQAVNAKLKGAP